MSDGPETLDELHELMDHDDNVHNILDGVIKASCSKSQCNTCRSCLVKFVQFLHNVGLLKDKPPKKVKPLESVTLELPDGMSMHQFGSIGRSCMLRATKHAKLKCTGPIFEAKVEWG